MGLTRIKSNTQSFLQPQLGQTVNVVIDPSIDWLRLGQTVHIPEGGIYTIEAQTGFIYTLKLQTAIAVPGTSVTANVIYPISDAGSELAWGAKEW